MSIAGGDAHFLVEISSIQHTKGGDDLLGAGDRSFLINVFCVENAALIDVHNHGAFGEDFWRGAQRCIRSGIVLAKAAANWLANSYRLAEAVALPESRIVPSIEGFTGCQQQSEGGTAGELQSKKHAPYHRRAGRRIKVISRVGQAILLWRPLKDEGSVSG